MRTLFLALLLLAGLYRTHPAYGLSPTAAGDEAPQVQMHNLELACQIIQSGNEGSYTTYECLTMLLPDLLNHLHWIYKFPIPPCGLWENRHEQTLWFAGVVVEHYEYFLGGIDYIARIEPPDIEWPANTCGDA